jgi:hypothetical protein
LHIRTLSRVLKNVARTENSFKWLPPSPPIDPLSLISGVLSFTSGILSVRVVQQKLDGTVIEEEMMDIGAHPGGAAGTTGHAQGVGVEERDGTDSQ